LKKKKKKKKKAFGKVSGNGCRTGVQFLEEQGLFSSPSRGEPIEVASISFLVVERTKLKADH
jgi:hypothetical protein